MLETLDYTILIGSIPTFLYFDLYLIYSYIDIRYSIYIFVPYWSLIWYIYIYCLHFYLPTELAELDPPGLLSCGVTKSSPVTGVATCTGSAPNWEAPLMLDNTACWKCVEREGKERVKRGLLNANENKCYKNGIFNAPSSYGRQSHFF